jgi:hypothetical protein
MRFPQTLNAPALLIDHDERLPVASRFPGVRYEDANLIWAFDIAGEKNEPRRTRLAKKISFGGTENQPRQAANKGAPLQASS